MNIFSVHFTKYHIKYWHCCIATKANKKKQREKKQITLQHEYSSAITWNKHNNIRKATLYCSGHLKEYSQD